MQLLLALAVLGLLCGPTSASAVLIGDFPGLEALIARADAVVILRIDEHVDVRPKRTLSTTHDCYVYQTLKGEIPAEKTIRLQLMDTRGSFVTPFALHSTHLMFLTRKRTPDEATEYRTIAFQGANIRVSPFGQEKPPAGETVPQQVRSLLAGTIAYDRERHEQEQTFLKRTLDRTGD